MNDQSATVDNDNNDKALSDHATQLAAFLSKQALTIATAESCTGGWIAKTFTDLAGSSSWFNSGAVTYSNEAKISLLGVESETLRAHGAVSEPVVRQMAEGALGLFGSNCSISVSGIAGPGGATDTKAVGLVWIAVAVEKAALQRVQSGMLGSSMAGSALESSFNETSVSASTAPQDVQVVACEYHFKGSREDVRRSAVVAAIQLAAKTLMAD